MWIYLPRKIIHSVVVLETTRDLGLEWSRGQICRSWSWSWSLTTGLGLAFKQDQDLINFYCAISAICDYYTSLRPTAPVSTWCTHSLDFMQSWNNICAGWKGVHCSATMAYLRGHIVPDWENLCYPTLCSWSATGTWTTRMWLHGHWILYQLSCRCSEWFDFIHCEP